LSQREEGVGNQDTSITSNDQKQIPRIEDSKAHHIKEIDNQSIDSAEQSSNLDEGSNDLLANTRPGEGDRRDDDQNIYIQIDRIKEQEIRQNVEILDEGKANDDPQNVENSISSSLEEKRHIESKGVERMTRENDGESNISSGQIHVKERQEKQYTKPELRIDTSFSTALTPVKEQKSTHFPTSTKSLDIAASTPEQHTMHEKIRALSSSRSLSPLRSSSTGVTSSSPTSYPSKRPSLSSFQSITSPRLLARLKKRELMFKRFEQQLSKVKSMQSDINAAAINVQPPVNFVNNFDDEKSVITAVTEATTYELGMSTSKMSFLPSLGESS